MKEEVVWVSRRVLAYILRLLYWRSVTSVNNSLLGDVHSAHLCCSSHEAALLLFFPVFFCLVSSFLLTALVPPL